MNVRGWARRFRKQNVLLVSVLLWCVHYTRPSYRHKAWDGACRGTPINYAGMALLHNEGRRAVGSTTIHTKVKRRAKTISP